MPTAQLCNTLQLPSVHGLGRSELLCVRRSAVQHGYGRAGFAKHELQDTYINLFSTFCFPGRGQPEGQAGGRSGWRGDGSSLHFNWLLPSRTLCQALPDISKKRLFCLGHHLRRENKASTREPEMYVHLKKKKHTKYLNLFVTSSI